MQAKLDEAEGRYMVPALVFPCLARHASGSVESLDLLVDTGASISFLPAASLPGVRAEATHRTTLADGRTAPTALAEVHVILPSAPQPAAAILTLRAGVFTEAAERGYGTLGMDLIRGLADRDGAMHVELADPSGAGRCGCVEAMQRGLEKGAAT